MNDFESISHLSTFSTRILEKPELIALRNQMYSLATEEGLLHVSSEAVLFMRKALEEHLKKIMGHISIRQSSQISKELDGDETTQQTTKIVTIEEIANAISMFPHILGEGLSVNQERIGFML